MYSAKLLIKCDFYGDRYSNRNHLVFSMHVWKSKKSYNTKQNSPPHNNPTILSSANINISALHTLKVL